MMFSKLLAAIALAPLVLAIPSTPTLVERQFHCDGFETHTATFDDLSFTEPDKQPVGTYLGIKYNEFFVDKFTGFINLPSGSQFAISYDYTKPRELKVDRSKNPKAVFDLSSLYLACSGGIPQGECHIRITAHKKNGATFHRDVKYPALGPADPATYKMKQFNFDTDSHFKDLVKVSFKATINGTGNFFGLMLDNVVTNHPLCPS